MRVAYIYRQDFIQNINFIDRSKVAFLTWFSVLLILVSVSVQFSASMCLDIFGKV